MEKHSDSPHVHPSHFKNTKIIATVGPSTNTYESVYGLIESGANGLRLNFSHGTHEERTQQIKWIRRASKELKKPVAIIADLQGPKIRLGDFEGVIPVQTGQSIVFEYKADYAQSGHLPTQYDLTQKVKRGQRVMLYDGKIITTVTSVSNGCVYVRAENEGILYQRKGINLPDTDFAGDIITEKDKKDIAYISTADIDYVALSFVQTAHDITGLKNRLKNLGCKAKVIAKIETVAAIENIEVIIEASDAVMVARGDLAIETSPESVPIVQRRIVGLGQRHGKLTIVATQMMASMTEQPEPTRAEVSDVATAVLIGADCVMLSDETASGKYPLHVVKMMKRVILYTENNTPLHVKFHEDRTEISKQEAVCRVIIELAKQVHAVAIVAETKSGATANHIAAMRPRMPIIAVTSDPRVAQQLAILYGTKSYVRPDSRLAAERLTTWLKENDILRKGDTIVSASGKYPGVIGTTDTIKVRVLE